MGVAWGSDSSGFRIQLVEKGALAFPASVPGPLMLLCMDFSTSVTRVWPILSLYDPAAPGLDPLTPATGSCELLPH